LAIVFLGIMDKKYKLEYKLVTVTNGMKISVNIL